MHGGVATGENYLKLFNVCQVVRFEGGDGLAEH